MKKYPIEGKEYGIDKFGEVWIWNPQINLWVWFDRSPNRWLKDHIASQEQEQDDK